MILSKNMHELLNKQYNGEIKSALLYKNLAAFCENSHYLGFSKFFEDKYTEELGHAEKFKNYMQSRDGYPVVNTEATDKISVEFQDGDFLAPFWAALHQEQRVTELINTIFAEARKENDFPTEVFLHEFLTEQLSEESELLPIIARLERVKSSPNGIYSVDKELGGLSK